MRFYALRLHEEAGMIKSSPQKLIAQGTDWRFLTALKELKGRGEAVEQAGEPRVPAIPAPNPALEPTPYSLVSLLGDVGHPPSPGMRTR